jgi:hypothetical protein
MDTNFSDEPITSIFSYPEKEDSIFIQKFGKGKVIPLQALTGP